MTTESRSCLSCGEVITTDICPCVEQRRLADQNRRKVEQRERQANGYTVYMIRLETHVAETIVQAHDRTKMLRELSKAEVEQGLEEALPAVASRVTFPGT